jgi:hypothetical protein
MSKNIKAVKGTLVYKQFIALEDGTEVQVRYNQKPELYAGTDTQLFEYTAKETVDGQKVEVTKYAVKVEDAVRAKRQTTKETVSNLLASGKTAEEIVAILAGK